MSELNLTAETFDAAVLQSEQLVLVDFWAPWCGPCKVMGPLLEELAKEWTHITVAKVNVDEQPQLATRYNILSIPTFIVFKGGQVVEQFSGSMSKDTFKARVEAHA